MLKKIIKKIQTPNNLFPMNLRFNSKNFKKFNYKIDFKDYDHREIERDDGIIFAYHFERPGLTWFELLFRNKYKENARAKLFEKLNDKLNDMGYPENTVISNVFFSHTTTLNGHYHSVTGNILILRPPEVEYNSEFMEKYLDQFPEDDDIDDEKENQIKPAK